MSSKIYGRYANKRWLRIIKTLSNNWQDIRELIFKLRIKDIMDARYLQIKLKELERKKQVAVEIFNNKKHWRLKF